VTRPGLITEHGFEAVRGLPEPLPPGEVLLWQGAPDWRGFARHALHLHWIAGYFVLLAGWRAADLLAGGATGAAALGGAGWLLLIGCGPLALLGFYAWAVARTSVYSLTSRRLVLRVGVALPVTINLPFALIDSAALKQHADGTGDIVLALTPPHRIAWLMLWPHARPWRMRDPQPMLRAIAAPQDVAQALSRALAGAAGQAVPAAPSGAAAADAGHLRPAAA
jgi:hypothetical protein